MELLPKIEDPDDLKKFSIDQLTQLAGEIRSFLLTSLAATGGHLASNLGVVELTLALHHVFDSPKDRLLFDVGHQTYVHKLLTGRRNLFPSLRQQGGLCGFPKRCESPHDVWETGHASTSLSAALGMATVRDLRGENHHVVPVIGDGAMTGGMALEALNHIGERAADLLVVLNDNAMSISPNVGALQKHLARLRTHPSYHQLKTGVGNVLHHVPLIGHPIIKGLEKLRDGLKYSLVSGVFFEALGFTYLGPVDGHVLSELLGMLHLAKKISGPVLLHVITTKGQGYKPAEEDAVRYHGVGAYKLEARMGEQRVEEPRDSSVQPPTYPEVFGQTILRLAERDPRLVAITPAMLTGSCLGAMQQKYPERTFDVAIAEQHALTFAAGLAIDGFRPVVAIYSTFLQRAYDQVIHDICRQQLPVLIAVDRAGLVGEDGETHQGVYDIGFLRNQPGLTLMMPKDENEFQHMLHTALSHSGGPVVVRYSKARGVGVPLDSEWVQLPLGKAEVVTPGRDVAFFALGTMISVAQGAARLLEEQGITARVINARFVKPLDEDLLVSLAEEGIPLITVEEGAVIGGMGSAVLECFAHHGILGLPIRLIGIPDRYIEHGSIQMQREAAGLTPVALVKAALALLRRSPATPAKSSPSQITGVG
ncbi:1-deoxy-D-xylulose-5-phosphate synthase [Pasteuria penetrans]|uniref:1-deoxy-D-xylulose-5-phosphate synthase n=1 Tax=Pasteuria penetrans TaxID=86005 RepID=UPI000F9F011B|nr:1-deoxy-D-xylulose-5-phosphate synthase [Pasteuria penetrans]